MTAFAAPRRRGHSPEALTFGRQAWRALVSEFRDAGGEILADRPLGPDREHTLRGAFRRAGGSLGENADRNRRSRLGDLPVDGSSAGPARDAFGAAAAGFLVATGERRSQFARLLLAACDLVEALLAAQGQADADRTWRRQFKEE